jgi:hypothetical protein
MPTMSAMSFVEVPAPDKSTTLWRLSSSIVVCCQNLLLISKVEVG